MIYLNNKKDGRQIQVCEILPNKGIVKYLSYNVPGRNIINLTALRLPNLIDYKKQTIASFGQIMKAMAIALIGFSVSNDAQNWLYPTKPIRVIFDNAASTSEMVNNSIYKLVIEAMIAKHNGYTTTQETVTVMYVDNIDPIDYKIIAPFMNNWIYIENKML